MRARVLAGLVVFGIAQVLFSHFGPAVRVRDVAASATYGDGREFSPWNTVDGCGVEAPRTHCYFLLPDATRGSLRYQLDGEHVLDRVSILDTQNRGFRDRGTSEVRIELVGRDAVTLHARLPRHPEWHSIDLGGRRAEVVVVHLDRTRGLGGGLDEVVLVGAPSTGLGRFVPLFVSLVLASVAMAMAPLLSSRWHEPRTKSALAFGGFAFVLLVVGFDRLRYSSGVSIFEWCLIFDVEELDSVAKAKDFFRHLMVPIPPVLALAEWGAYRLTGTSELVTRTLYKISILGAYVLALRLAFPSVLRMLVITSASVVAIAGTAAIHPGNPQVYDVVFPALLLSFVATLSRTVRAAGASRVAVAWGLVSGASLALLGLTRPFGVVLVPAALAIALSDRRMRSPRTLSAFLLPVVLLFGGWHLHLYRAHGQTTFSNNAGFNLIRAWPEATRPPLERETFEPPYRALNNPIHAENSRRLEKAVREYIVSHPRQALVRVAERLVGLVEPRTIILADRFLPDEDWLGAYRFAVRALAVLFVVVLLLRLAAWARRWRRGEPVDDEDHPTVALDALVLLTVLAAVSTCIGETGEEARFLVALLPMLAAGPALIPWRRC